MSIHGGYTKIETLHERAAHLKTLEKGWDSYGGEPVDHETVDKAVEVARALPDLGTAQLVPCSDGTVQIEWHSKGWDIELWIQRVDA